MYLKKLISIPNLTKINGRIHQIRSNSSASSAGTPELRPGDGDSGEFLSRFVWIMRKKVTEAYPNSDKSTVNGMLRVIADQVVSEIAGDSDDRAPAPEFSDDLWRTVREVSETVLSDMKRAEKKEKMRRFLQCDEVKEMTRFAVEVGVRGDMLRDMRFRWACEKMEEAEFQEGLDRLCGDDDEVEKEREDCVVPERRGSFGFRIYGLDLSDPKWASVADGVRGAGEDIWPDDAKPLAGKSRVVYEKILGLSEEDDPSPLLGEWVELVQPGRADWNALLGGLKEKNTRVYFKVAELLLSESSFETNVCDYSSLMGAYAKANQVEDAERIVQKMKEKGIAADLVTVTNLVHMYCKAGSLDRAKEAYKTLKMNGFQPDANMYSSMIMACVNAGKPDEGLDLMAEMNHRSIRPTYDLFLALLGSFAQSSSGGAGADKVVDYMLWAGFDSGIETWKLRIKAYAKAGDPENARYRFDCMLKAGLKPDDECTASMIAAYEAKNMMDDALRLLSQLEKDGFQLGVATYSVLVDWLGKLKLVDEAEQLLGKISELGEAPPVKLHISLCDMYSRAGYEKKALQALGVLEAKKDELGSDEFERIIKALAAGRFTAQAHRMLALMEARGFAAPEQLKRELLALQTFSRNRPSMR